MGNKFHIIINKSESALKLRLYINMGPCSNLKNLIKKINFIRGERESNIFNYLVLILNFFINNYIKIIPYQKN